MADMDTTTPMAILGMATVLITTKSTAKEISTAIEEEMDGAMASGVGMESQEREATVLPTNLQEMRLRLLATRLTMETLLIRMPRTRRRRSEATLTRLETLRPPPMASGARNQTISSGGTNLRGIMVLTA